MVCPKCSYDNKSSNIKCEKCGEQLINFEDIENINFDSKKNQKRGLVKEAKFESTVTAFYGVSAIFGGTIFCGILSMCIYKGADTITKVACIPFLICGIAILIYGISMVIKGIKDKKKIDDYVNGKLDKDKAEKSEKNFKKLEVIINYIYLFGFLLFYFGFIIIFDVFAIKFWSNGGNQMFFFSIFFWILGIYILIVNIKKNNNR